MDRLYSYTRALCPECRALVPARNIERDGRIRLEKMCPVHGISSAMVCSDPAWYRESRKYVKAGQEPSGRSVSAFSGCPDSCGFCPEHRQHSCLPIVEVTSRCDLSCPICLKRFPVPFEMTVEQYRSVLDRLFECEGNVPVVNLSGGEPTLHAEFERLLRISAERGVVQTTVSTNGLRLHREKGLRELFRETGTIAALQFDGFSPEVHRKLRGADLTEIKEETVRRLEEDGVRYTLTATVVKGVNDREIPAITEFFFGSKAISIMFQPAAFTGAAESFRTASDRLTIPDVVRAIGECNQAKAEDFNPLPCSHPSCFALSYYLDLGDGTFTNLKDFLGKEGYLEIIANRTLPGLEPEGYALIKERIYELWSAADGSETGDRVLARVRSILRELSCSPFSPKRAFELGAASMKGIFIHHFMDVDTFDAGRLMKCCNPYPQADGRLMPACAQNLFFQG